MIFMVRKKELENTFKALHNLIVSKQGAVCLIKNDYKWSDEHVSIRLKGNTADKKKHWLCECDPSIVNQNQNTINKHWHLT